MPYIAPKKRLIELLEEKIGIFPAKKFVSQTRRKDQGLLQPQPKIAVLQSISSCYHLL
ncbi:hypothetical protein SK143_1304 [Streptococcus oralis]|uniref:Uncharacterized protein n=1 Tax=Streptococcus oralis TaxID=1303 RepID=A0A081R4Q8_STROR|nr:hypothetical protein SK143_1304 [Streptococcus oralis]